MSLTYVTVTKTYLGLNGLTPLVGGVTFQPVNGATGQAVNLYQNGNLLASKAPIQATLDSTGSISVSLLATDNAGITPTGWLWRVKEYVPGGSTYLVVLPSADAPTVALSSLTEIPNPSNVTVSTSAVSSVNGLAGAVTLENTDGTLAVATQGNDILLSVVPGTIPVVSALTPSYGIVPNAVSDQAPAINAAIRSLAASGQAVALWFPNETFYINSAIEVPRNVAIWGNYVYGAVTFKALSTFSDYQLMRNWQAADGGTFYAPSTTAWNSGIGNNYIDLRYIAFNTTSLTSSTPISMLGLVHLQERSLIEGLSFTNNGSATNLTMISLFSNSEAGTNGRLKITNWRGYGKGFKNFVNFDGTNGGAVAKGIIDVELSDFTSPANANNQVTASVCSDSPFYLKNCQSVRVSGHCETPPPNGLNDTACVRLINCSQTKIYDFHYAPGPGAHRPFMRATQNGSVGSVLASQGSPLLDNIIIDGTTIWSNPRKDSVGASAYSSASSTITDGSIVAADVGRAVIGPNIPPGSYVGTPLTAGTSFTLVNAAGTAVLPYSQLTLDASTAIYVGDNVIEDESDVGGSPAGSGISRHFLASNGYFMPLTIGHYDGPSIRWLQTSASDNGAAAPDPFWYEAHSYQYDLRVNQPGLASGDLPVGVVAESVPRVYGVSPVDASSTVCSSQNVKATGVFMYPGDLISNLICWVGSVGSTGLTNQFLGVIDPLGNVVAISTDHTTTTWTATTKKTFAMQNPYPAQMIGLAFWFILLNGTIPYIEGVNQGQVAQMNPTDGNLQGTVTTIASLNTNQTISSLAYNSGNPNRAVMVAT